MAEQFSQTVASLLSSPNSSQCAPATPTFGTFRRPSQTPSVVVAKAKLREEVVIFDFTSNTFCYTVYRAIRPSLTSYRERVYQIPISKFTTRVDLRSTGLETGEGDVGEGDEKALPIKVVIGRLFGKFKTLYIVQRLDLPFE